MKIILYLPIIITKNNNNEINSFYNVCRHRGCKLVNQDKNSSAITCRYHKWIYSLEGELMGIPHYKPEKEVLDKKDFSLFPIKTSVKNNLIFANLDNNYTETLEETYQDAFTILDDYPLKNCKIVKTKKYMVNSNWKLLIDNFIEYYHLPGVHPRLVKNSGINEHICTQGNGKYIGFKTKPLTSSGEPIDIEEMKPITGLDSKYHNTSTFQILFPNHIFYVLVQPISPTKSIEYTTLMVDKDIKNND